jgi:hypothetical protein
MKGRLIRANRRPAENMTFSRPLFVTLLVARLTFPHYRMSSLREIGGASRSIRGPYAD